jgi:hypothetical protein
LLGFLSLARSRVNSVSCRVAAVSSVRARCGLIQPVAENLFSNFKY